MNSDSVSRYVAKPATAFCIGSAIGGYMQPGLEVDIFGMPVPAWVLGGLVGLVGSEASALANEYLWPHAGHATLLERPLETFAAITTNAGAGALAYTLLTPGALGEVGLVQLVGASALIEVSSGYITDKWLKPVIEQYM